MELGGEKTVYTPGSDRKPNRPIYSHLRIKLALLLVKTWPLWANEVTFTLNE